jgi:hypothetical protein
MNELPPQKDERDFFRVVKVSTALGVGVLAAFLYSLKRVHPDIVFKFTLGTALIFLVVGGFSWFFCGVLARAGSADGDQSAGRRKFIVRWLLWFFGVTMLGTIAAFAYALKDVASESRRDVIEGTLIAIVVLGLGGLLIVKAFKFLEAQSEAELEQRREDEERED